MSNVTGPGTAPDRDQRFVRLVDQYQEQLLRLCCYCLRDRSMAEDAVQETFLKVYRTMDSFRGDCSEKTWIMKIAMHVCCDIRRTGWFRFVNRRVTPDMFADRTAAVLPDDRDEELSSAVMKLPHRLREVILLYYYQGMKVNEIADALGISRPAVSARLIRGRERLKNQLEGRELDEQEDQS